MKYVNYLKEIDHVSLYPVIALIMFTAIFAIVATYVFTADKSKMKKNANMIMESDDHSAE